MSFSLSSLSFIPFLFILLLENNEGKKRKENILLFSGQHPDLVSRGLGMSHDNDASSGLNQGIQHHLDRRSFTSGKVLAVRALIEFLNHCRSAVFHVVIIVAVLFFYQHRAQFQSEKEMAAGLALSLSDIYSMLLVFLLSDTAVTTSCG